MDKIDEIFVDLTKSMSGDLNRLTQEKKHLDSEVRKLINERESPKNYNVERVLLDIGGFHFSTSIHTLTAIPDSYFGRLFSGTFPSDMVGDDGRVFLDRDGSYFRYILNFLRDPGSFVLKLKNKQELDLLRGEAAFYGLEDRMFQNSVFIPDTLNWLDEKKIVLKEFSSEHSDSFPARNVLDYSRTYWLSTPGLITDQWLVFDFEKEAYLSKISVKVDSYECTVKDFSLQYSEGDDCKEWVTIKEFQAKCGNQCTEEQFFDGFEFRGRYMRMFCKNNWGPGGGNFILITNIKFFGSLIE